MKITYPQFEQQIEKKLAPLYVIHGDELLLVRDAVDLLQVAARKAGFSERVSLSIDSGSDWGKLLHTEIYSRSLFASKRLIELHLGETKPNPAANKILKEICADLPADCLLLITANKLDSKTEQTTWFKALDKIGVTLPLWPIAPAQLPGWIMQRAKKAGLTLTTDAAKLLAGQIEGNLLAAAQEIEKLLLLEVSGVIDVDMITTAVTDSARFDIFNLVDSALLGEGQRSLHILKHLQAEGTEPVLVLWALARELRTLTDLQKQASQGKPLGSLFSKYRIWEKRQANVRHFLRQHPLARCHAMLSECSQIDRTIKGARKGNTWDALQQLTLRMAGSDIIKVMV
jgi:DNA polymerase-3 subunit delta